MDILKNHFVSSNPNVPRDDGTNKEHIKPHSICTQWEKKPTFQHNPNPLTETGNFPNLFRKRTSKWYITGQLWEEAHFLEKRFSLEAIALLIICQIKCLIFGGALMFQTYFQNNGDSVYPVPYNLFRVAWNRNWNFNQWPGENCS